MEDAFYFDFPETVIFTGNMHENKTMSVASTVLPTAPTSIYPRHTYGHANAKKRADGNICN